MYNNLTILIPVWWRDKDRVVDTIESLKKHIEPRKIVLAGPESMREYVHVDDPIVEYVDGNTIVPNMSRERVEELISRRQSEANVEVDTSRAGWLFQQFIKLGFAEFSKDEEYLVWDADVLLLNDFEIKKDGKPKFFLYDRHLHVEYLPAIKSMLGENIRPQGEYTFVNHYMVFEGEMVRRMLSDIGNNENIEGEFWWEKCVNAIPLPELTESGFSEFETYGEYVISRYPEQYVYEFGYNHLLRSKRYFGETVSEEFQKWLSDEYMTIGFEGYDIPDDYWIKQTVKAYEQGKRFSRVEKRDIFRAKIEELVNKMKKPN